MGRFQNGYVSEAYGAFHVRYYLTELVDGKPVRRQKSTRLCAKDNKHYSAKCKPVQQLAAQFMQRVNALGGNMPQQDVSVVDFWEQTYKPHLQKAVKASTINGYLKMWKQHLAPAFAGHALRDYQTFQATQLLTNLAERGLGRRTIAHIRSLASGLFRHALRLNRINTNPWRDAGSLFPVKEPEATYAYTLEEAEAIINGLIANPSAQLVFGLTAFIGLRPSEISGLRWEDIDTDWIHIRRAAVRGVVDTTKTPESVSSVPLIEPIRGMLAAWHLRCGNGDGWVFPNRLGDPMEMSGFARRVIAPVLKAQGIVWKGLYAGRRAAGTLLTQLTGDALAASYVLRHKNLATTTAFYVKPVRTAADEGMKALEGAWAKQIARSDGPKAKALAANAAETANGSEKQR
jgi:integrase